MASPPVVIKKYGNRRLYDTGESRYITLDELAAKIRSGADVRVVDAQSSEDLTQATLTQIVLETGNAAKFLPVQLLTQMIRLSDDALAEFFSRYVTGALDLYLGAKRGVQTLAAYNPLTQLPMAATDAIARMWMGSPFGGPAYQAAPPPAYAYGNPPYVAPPPDAYNASPYAAPPHVAPPPAASDDDATGDDVLEAIPQDQRAGRPTRHRDASAQDAEVALMRRELDELKQAIREGLAAKPARGKKRKP